MVSLFHSTQNNQRVFLYVFYVVEGLVFRSRLPGHKESAGKRLSGRSRPGNQYVRAALVQAAHGVRRSRTYLGERYRRLKKRRGSKRAALAVGHSILVIYYQMMKTGEEYQEKGEEFFLRKDRGKVERQLVRRLERLGYQVTAPPPAARTTRIGQHKYE